MPLRLALRQTFFVAIQQQPVDLEPDSACPSFQRLLSIRPVRKQPTYPGLHHPRAAQPVKPATGRERPRCLLAHSEAAPTTAVARTMEVRTDRQMVMPMAGAMRMSLTTPSQSIPAAPSLTSQQSRCIQLVQIERPFSSRPRARRLCRATQTRRSTRPYHQGRRLI